MKCPYCGEKGVKVLPNMVCPERSIHAALNCSNPECSAYDPVAHGYHDRMPAEKKDILQRVMRAIQEESDFDPIPFKHLKA